MNNIEKKREDVKIMTEVFRNAMIFEKYVEIWTDSLAYVDQLLDENETSRKNALSGIESEQLLIDSIDIDYAMRIENERNEVKKSRNIILTIIAIVAAIVIFVLALWFFGLYTAAAIIAAFLAGGILPMIILGIIGYYLYKIYKSKNRIKELNPENKEYRIKVSINNIESYKTYLDKNENEKKYYLSKKEIILKQLNDAKRVLYGIYALDLIPAKYTSLVPVATMYGYLVNRICNVISGADGVYSRYEIDLRLGAIISNLIEINQKLDVVISNQNKLYELVGSINATLGSIKNELSYANKKIDKIESNSAISATAARQSAEAQSYIASEFLRHN